MRAAGYYYLGAAQLGVSMYIDVRTLWHVRAAACLLCA